MVTLEQARMALPEEYRVSDAELETVLAYFYFLGEQAYEQVQLKHRETGDDQD